MNARAWLAAAGLTVGLVVGVAAPAFAVQTSTLGLSPAPTAAGASRTVLLERNGQSLSDVVEVANKGSAPETVQLGVVPVTRSAAGFTLGGPPTAWTRGIRVGTTTLHLSPGQVVKVPVSAPERKGPTAWAAVTAQAAGSVQSGGIDVAERLAVLIESPGSGVASPAQAGVPAGAATSGLPVPASTSLPLGWPLAAGGLLAAVAAGVVVPARRSWVERGTG